MLVLFVILVGVLGLVIYNAIGWPGVGDASSCPSGSVSVLIPARNEEAHIRDALMPVLDQGAVVKEVLVYDDHSIDRTAAYVREVSMRSEKVRLIPPLALPQGWCGKPFACAQLAAVASGDWLLFIDADARIQPGAAGRMVTEAMQRKATLLSFWPGLDMKGFWERALMPMLNFVVFSMFPAPLSFHMQMPALGLAHGACILIRRDVYQLTGGHAMVRAELFEDTVLARAWRKAGQTGFCMDGQDVVRVRMYDSLSGIWTGFQKNTYPAFRHEVNFWLFLLFHAVCFLMPFGMMFFSRAALASAVVIVLMRLVQAARFHYSWWAALLHPMAEIGLLAVALRSWFRCHHGEGVEWKGRVYQGRGMGAA